MFRIHQAFRAAPQVFLAFRGIHGNGIIVNAGQDARDIGVYNGSRLVEGEGEERSRRVGADARQAFQPFRIVREAPSEFVDDFPGDGLEGTHAAVIAQSFPGAQGRLFVHGSQMRRSGELAHPSVISSQNGGNGSLLQHQLGNKDVPRIRCPPPRVIPPFAPEPFYQRVPESMDVKMGGGVSHAFVQEPGAWRKYPA